MTTRISSGGGALDGFQGCGRHHSLYTQAKTACSEMGQCGSITGSPEPRGAVIHHNGKEKVVAKTATV